MNYEPMSEFSALLFKYLFFASGVDYPLCPEIFYIITQWSCSASGSLWEMPDRTLDLCPISLSEYTVDFIEDEMFYSK